MQARWLAGRRNWLVLTLTTLVVLGGCGKSDREAETLSAAAIENIQELAKADERVDSLTLELEQGRQVREQRETRVATVTAEAERTAELLKDARQRQTRYCWIAVGAAVGGVVLFLLGAALAAGSPPVTALASEQHPKALQGGSHVES